MNPRSTIIMEADGMACIHLQQLYDLCQQHDLKLGGSDLIHIVCHQCGKQEVCPSMLIDEEDAASERADQAAAGGATQQTLR